MWRRPKYQANDQLCAIDPDIEILQLEVDGKNYGKHKQSEYHELKFLDFQNFPWNNRRFLRYLNGLWSIKRDPIKVFAPLLKQNKVWRRDLAFFGKKGILCIIDGHCWRTYGDESETVSLFTNSQNLYLAMNVRRKKIQVTHDIMASRKAVLQTLWEYISCYFRRKSSVLRINKGRLETQETAPQ